MIFATGRVEEKFRVLWRRDFESYGLSANTRVVVLNLPLTTWQCSAREKPNIRHARIEAKEYNVLWAQR